MGFWKWVSEKLDRYLEASSRFNKTEAAMYFHMIFIIPLTIVFLGIVLLFSRWNSNMLWIKDKMNPNIIIVERTGFAPEDNIAIKWTCDSYCDTITIYARNKACNKNFKISGENIFLVYLNDSLIYRERQFKAASWQGFRYNFKISKENGKFRTKLLIME